ncbi:hypothetical protein [Patulibacter sp.]|uniref:hypothetical protein n=1 Tax=Patulibacter sp. TaxID=1912859 RepID=UPI00271DC0F2|nr:hypothetical protein [Patulibacter sp.]MDO9406846.1 hypothetical protein [Patulibacter sp.]
MIPRPHRPSSPVRALLAPALVAVAIGLTACGGGGDAGDGATARTTAPATTTEAADAPRLGTGDAKEAAGTVSVCGATSEMRLLQPAIRRFDGVSERLQASTLGFPDGDGRPLRAFQARQRAESRDCDVYVAAGSDEIPALGADGDLYDLAPALEGWTAAPGAQPLAPVLDGERAFGLPVRADDASGVMVLSVHGRNPGGALELLRALADARLRDD